MVEILNRILDISVETFGANPLEVLCMLFLLIVFLWLYKELRSQQMEEIALQKERAERLLASFSLILLEGNTYHTTSDKVAFIQAVYSALPFMEYKLSKEILTILEDNSTEAVKVQTITEKIKDEVLFLSSFSNRYLFKTKLLTEDVEKFFIKLRRIFGPAMASFFIIYSVLLILSISFSGTTYWWMFAKPLCFITACLLVPFTIDLVMEKKATKMVIGLLLGIFISAIFLVSGLENYALYSFLAFIAFLGGLAFYGYKLASRSGNPEI
ncbi:MAG: hypothetical protein WBF39_17290 [Planococcus donghaensis]